MRDMEMAKLQKLAITSGMSEMYNNSLRNVLFVPEKPVECIEHEDPDAPAWIWLTVLTVLVCGSVLIAFLNKDAMKVCLQKYSKEVCVHTLREGV